MIRVYLVISAVALGIVAIGLRFDFCSRFEVTLLNDNHLDQFIGGGGAPCYGESQHRCGASPQNGCENEACTKRPGTTVYKCYNGDSLGTIASYGVYTTQPSYDHYVELASGAGLDGLTSSEELPCNKYYCCGCDSNDDCSQLVAEDACVDIDGDFGDPTTFFRRKPTGEECEVGE